MERIRIMMTDDSPEIRSYFSNIISHEADMELVGTAASGAEAVQMAHELRPDIILMDIQMETRIAGISSALSIIISAPYSSSSDRGLKPQVTPTVVTPAFLPVSMSVLVSPKYKHSLLPTPNRLSIS